MDAQLNAELANAQQCLLETFELATMYGDNSLQDGSAYLKLMSSLCEIRNTSERQEQALAEAREQRTIDDFDKIRKEHLAKSSFKKFNPKTTSAYKEFRQSLEQMAATRAASTQASASTTDAAAATHTNRVECEDLVMESEINVIDPLTKRRMHDPVRNSICGHHYEKETVLEAIGINHRLRCPVAGCGNKTFVQREHLLDDAVFRMHLMQASEQESEDPLG